MGLSVKVSAWVRMTLGNRRISDAEMARRIGMAQQTFSRKVLGGSAFSVDEVALLAEQLELSLCDLINAAAAIPDDDAILAARRPKRPRGL